MPSDYVAARRRVGLGGRYKAPTVRWPDEKGEGRGGFPTLKCPRFARTRLFSPPREEWPGYLMAGTGIGVLAFGIGLLLRGAPRG